MNAVNSNPGRLPQSRTKGTQLHGRTPSTGKTIIPTQARPPPSRGVQEAVGLRRIPPTTKHVQFAVTTGNDNRINSVPQPHMTNSMSADRPWSSLWSWRRIPPLSKKTFPPCVDAEPLSWPRYCGLWHTILVPHPKRLHGFRVSWAEYNASPGNTKNRVAPARLQLNDAPNWPARASTKFRGRFGRT